MGAATCFNLLSNKNCRSGPVTHTGLHWKMRSADNCESMHVFKVLSWTPATSASYRNSMLLLSG